MWCDLRKPVTWRKIYILSYWFHVKVWIILFPNLFTLISSDTAVKSYWCSKATKNKEKHQNYDVNFLYFAVSPFARCDRLSQITSHMDPTYQSMISSPGCTSTMQQILGNLWFHLCNIRKRGKHIYLLKTLLDSWNENLIKMENVVF